MVCWRKSGCGRGNQRSFIDFRIVRIAYEETWLLVFLFGYRRILGWIRPCPAFTQGVKSIKFQMTIRLITVKAGLHKANWVNKLRLNMPLGTRDPYGYYDEHHEVEDMCSNDNPF